MRYAINDLYKTIQGEGVQAGRPMTFLRLQGCGVACRFCDSKRTWARFADYEMPDLGALLGLRARQAAGGPVSRAAAAHWAWASEGEILDAVRALPHKRGWVCITGGEPAEQDLKPLAGALSKAGYYTALETSGTATGHLSARFEWITCSPKWAMEGGRAVVPEAVYPAHEIRLLVRNAQDIARLQSFLYEHRSLVRNDVQFCLSPVWGSQEALALCIAECMAKGWRLSLQTHKFVNLP